MAIRDENTSTDVLLKDALFHEAALLAHPATVDLAPAVQAESESLEAREKDTRAAETKEVKAFAVLLRHDFEIDELIRGADAELLVAVGRDRDNPTYREALPGGMGALVSLRGEEEARGVRILLAVLATHHPTIAQKYEPKLSPLLDSSIAAEQAWKDAASVAGQARVSEYLARASLVRLLRKNEGILLSLFPGQKKKVRSFFRSSTKSKPKAKPTPPLAPPAIA